jgi:hypothetical protein
MGDPHGQPPFRTMSHSASQMFIWAGGGDALLLVQDFGVAGWMRCGCLSQVWAGMALWSCLGTQPVGDDMATSRTRRDCSATVGRFN